jgi:hypothetical protein
MKLDMQRIWKRNLGRDDRCIADNGKEVMFQIIARMLISCLLSDLSFFWFVFSLGQIPVLG